MKSQDFFKFINFFLFYFYRVDVRLDLISKAAKPDTVISLENKVRGFQGFRAAFAEASTLHFQLRISFSLITKLFGLKSVPEPGARYKIRF